MCEYQAIHEGYMGEMGREREESQWKVRLLVFSLYFFILYVFTHVIWIF